MRRFILTLTLLFACVSCSRRTDQQLSFESSELLRLLTPSTVAFYAWKADSPAFDRAANGLQDGAVTSLPLLLAERILAQRGFVALTSALQQAGIFRAGSPPALREALVFYEGGDAGGTGMVLLVSSQVSLSQFVSILQKEAVTAGVALTRESLQGVSGYRLVPPPRIPGGTASFEQHDLFLVAQGERLALTTSTALIKRMFQSPPPESALLDTPLFGALSLPVRAAESLLALGFVDTRALLTHISSLPPFASPRVAELAANFPARAIVVASHFDSTLSTKARLLIEGVSEQQQRWVEALATRASPAPLELLSRTAPLSVAFSGEMLLALRSLLLAEQPIDVQRRIDPFMHHFDGLSGVGMILRQLNGIPSLTAQLRCGTTCASVDSAIRTFLGATVAGSAVGEKAWREETAKTPGFTLPTPLGLTVALRGSEGAVTLSSSVQALAFEHEALRSDGDRLAPSQRSALEAKAPTLAARLDLGPTLQIVDSLLGSAAEGAEDTAISREYLRRLVPLGALLVAVKMAGNVLEIEVQHDSPGKP